MRRKPRRTTKGRTRPPPISKADLARREQAIRKAPLPDPRREGDTCWVLGCARPALGGSTKPGLGKYCRPHLEHWRRHGHTTRPSYTAALLSPYRHAAWVWLTRNAETFIVANALKRIETRLHGSGPLVEADAARRRSPDEKALAVWSRMRHREVDPKAILAAALGVEMAFSEDPDPPLTTGPDKSREFPRVQMARILNRHGGGLIKEWRRTSAPGSRTRVEARSLPQGMFLRRLGKQIEKDAELVVQHHLADVLATKREMEAMTTKAGKPKTNWRSRPLPHGHGNKGRKTEVIMIEDGPAWGGPSGPNRPKTVEEIKTPAGPVLRVLRH